MRIALVLLLSTIAHADSNDIITRSLVLPRNAFRASLTLEYSLAKRHSGTPVSLAPDVWFGATDELTVGVIHSSPSVDRIGGRASFCIRQSDTTCDQAYQGSGVDAMYRLRSWVAPRARLLIRDTDTFKPALTLGALARWTHGRFSITTDPFLRFGLANTDKGNRTAFSIPLYLGVQPTCRWLIEFHTGADGDVAVLSDGWHMPVALKVTARATRDLDVVFEGGLPQGFGPQVNADEREVMFSASYSR